MAKAGAMHATRQAMGPAFAVIWFVVLFVGAIIVAIVTLSASQLQSRLQTLSRADTPFSVWQIERIRTKWETQQTAIDTQVLRVAALRQAWTGSDADMQDARIRHQATVSSYEGARDDIIAKLKLYNPLAFPEKPAEMNEQELRALVDRAFAEIVERLLETTRATIALLNTSYQNALKAKDDAANVLAQASAKATSALDLLSREEEVLAAAEKKLDAIIDPDGTMTVADTTRIYDLISEFAFIENFAFGTLYRFAILPNEFLIIVLVVFMGVLGSTLQLTYDYYRNGGVDKTSLFFLRPMLGAITALVVFVLLKAGVLVITDSAKLGEVAPLNPFFIAFVGIVSGLLSESALETVRRVGQAWLRGSASDRDARWASNVQASLSAEKTLADLSQRTGIELDLLEKWAGMEEKVPPDMQKMFAAWLDKDMASLFTDIAPVRP